MYIFLKNPIRNPDGLNPYRSNENRVERLCGMRFGRPNDKYLIAGGVNGGGAKMFERINGGSFSRNDMISKPGRRIDRIVYTLPDSLSIQLIIERLLYLSDRPSFQYFRLLMYANDRSEYRLQV
jgi:hypothetical protein